MRDGDPVSARLSRRRVTVGAAGRRRGRQDVHPAGARHGRRPGPGSAARPARRGGEPADDPHQRQRRQGRSPSSTSSSRDALYRELEPSRRAELHWRVGTALEQVNRGDLDPHLAELAHHFLLAIGPGRDAGRAVEYSARAGERAMAQTAYDEAAAHFRRALDTLVSSGNSDPVRRCDLLLALGAARTRSGDTGAGRSTYLEAASAGPPRRAR